MSANIGFATALVEICEGRLVLAGMFGFVSNLLSSGGVLWRGVFRASDTVSAGKSRLEVVGSKAGAAVGAGSFGLFGNNSSRRASALELAAADPAPLRPVGFGTLATSDTVGVFGRVGI